MGYHKNTIKRGLLCEFSKIQEEFEELVDAHEQGAKILELCELSDLYGAIESYVQYKYRLSMEDIKKMSDLTISAFTDGSRE
jgi:hypothetical protein